MEKNNRPIPTPAENNIANQEKFENSGARIVIAEANAAVPAAHQIETNGQHDAKGADVVPAERGLDPTTDCGIDAVREIDIQRGEDHEGHNHALGGQSHAAV